MATSSCSSGSAPASAASETLGRVLVPGRGSIVWKWASDGRPDWVTLALRTLIVGRGLWDCVPGVVTEGRGGGSGLN